MSTRAAAPAHTTIKRDGVLMMFREGVIGANSDGRELIMQSQAPDIGQAYTFPPQNTEPSCTRVYFDVRAGLGVQMDVMIFDPAEVHCRVEQITQILGGVSVVHSFADIADHVDCGVAYTPTRDTSGNPHVKFGWRVTTTIDGNVSVFIIVCNFHGTEYVHIGRTSSPGLPIPWTCNRTASARRIFDLVVPALIDASDAESDDMGDGWGSDDGSDDEIPDEDSDREDLDDRVRQPQAHSGFGGGALDAWARAVRPRAAHAYAAAAADDEPRVWNPYYPRPHAASSGFGDGAVYTWARRDPPRTRHYSPAAWVDPE